ncbi:unnamed protein product [Psylliodes chrysocephalus]|uniref:Magnesium transporter n=1 Tax=Psylliodes chrysocephalus TaxID=3402493 RepID=A0A9P0G8C6_9CUCU|nr:unnamed protein product [Psylliodes chrysocephala]
MDVTTEPTKLKMYTSSGHYMGLVLAVSSSLFIGSSFIIKKISLIRLGKKGSIRAGAGGFGYLRDWMWWLGLLTMGIGELANFTAYAFAPASLVTPLGALSVLVSAVLASVFLNEKLNLLGKLGCILCVLGSTIIVIHSPKEEQVVTVAELLKQVQNIAFINYVVTVIVLVILILFFVGPIYGTRYIIIYLLLCSAIGSLTVMACKALGLVLKENSVTPYQDQHNILLPILLFVIVVFCICIQMNYLNKALDLFNTTIVTPIYYVLFTTLVIFASAILFEEWQHMNYTDILGATCGFLVTVVAIFLLHFFKDGTTLLPHQHRSNSSQYGSHINFEVRSV